MPALKHLTRFDGRLHIYQRPRSPYWQCGFHFKGKYYRHSTKEMDDKTAIRAAEQWYIGTQASLRFDPDLVQGKTVRAVVPLVLRSLEERVQRGERSASYLTSVRNIMKAVIVPYFGSSLVEKIDHPAWEKFKRAQYEQSPNLARATLHQRKNALRLVLNHAYRMGWIKVLPTFKDEYASNGAKTPRVWFDEREYRQLINALRRRIKTLEKTRWQEDAKELYDYVLFVANTGLRPSEARNVRFCDCHIREEVIDGERRRHLMIRNIRGKRGTGECRSMDGAVVAFERICARRKMSKPQQSQEQLFLHYHRDMFREVLDDAKLRLSQEQPPRKRDLAALRATYIYFRLTSGANVWEVATNVRTSVQMIQDHYLRFVSPRHTTGLNVLKKATVWKTT